MAEVRRDAELAAVPAPLRCLFLGRFGTAEALCRHRDVENPDLDEVVLYPDSVQRWEAYCSAVERRILGTEDDANGATDGSGVSVFGTCRRCGSSRLLVTTRQLRRADEGMTEIRQCKACGHVTKVNS
jgi:DNA-directed RNA polymerase subunit M/transcription elongation factor TFIIS